MFDESLITHWHSAHCVGNSNHCSVAIEFLVKDSISFPQVKYFKRPIEFQSLVVTTRADSEKFIRDNQIFKVTTGLH